MWIAQGDAAMSRAQTIEFPIERVMAAPATGNRFDRERNEDGREERRDAPECRDGVCLVTWKPSRPAAA